MKAIEMLSDLCRGCGACTGACPFNVITVDGGRAVIGEGCTLCGACVSSCLLEAIVLRSQTEAVIQSPGTWQGVWVFGEQSDGVPVGVVLELLGEGRKLADALGVELCAVLLGADTADAAGRLIAHGADRVYRVDCESLRRFNDESYADLFVQLIRTYRPEIVLLGATTYGRSLAPRVASRLDTGLTADCTALEIDPDRRIVLQTRPAFGGNLMATIICPERRPQMCTVRPKVMKALAPDSARPGVIVDAAAAVPGQTAVQVKDAVKTLVEAVNLAEADIVVSAGRGIGGPQNLRLVEELAEVLGGALGASRAVVDAGWAAYSRQVGQTGRTVSPRVYFACGISGAVQHLAGMSSSDRIVAVNRDPDAPIFKVAHYGIVGDLLEVLPAMTREFRVRLGK
jgi:electron transfer flavoprotein alpha subunit